MWPNPGKKGAVVGIILYVISMFTKPTHGRPNPTVLQSSSISLCSLAKRCRFFQVGSVLFIAVPLTMPRAGIPDSLGFGEHVQPLGSPACLAGSVFLVHQVAKKLAYREFVSSCHFSDVLLCARIHVEAGQVRFKLSWSCFVHCYPPRTLQVSHPLSCSLGNCNLSFTNLATAKLLQRTERPARCPVL